MTTKPFANCVVDFTGPYLTIQGRGRSRAKRYLFVFLPANPLLSLRDGNLAGYRSVSERICVNGSLERMADQHAGWSDNGMNFMGAKKEIRELVSHGLPGTGILHSLLTSDACLNQ